MNNSEFIYLDVNNNIVSEDCATKVVIRELDDNGVLINETWLNKENNNNALDVNSMQYTQEELDFLNEVLPSEKSR